MTKLFSFTVDLEEYDLLYFNHLDYKYRNDYFIYFTDHILDLFDKYNLKATFFCLGYLAEKYPKVIKSIHFRGHEIASWI